MTLYIITKKAKRTQKLNDIRTIEIENDTIKIYFENKTCLTYKYNDIKNVDICIDTDEGFRPLAGFFTGTFIRNTTVSILFNDGNLWKFDFFYDKSKKSIDTIRYILKEFQDYKINIEYKGCGNISKLKQEISG